MENITKMKILKPLHDVFEAFVDPEKIGRFWFSSSSERWRQGKTMTLRYEEYGAEGNIKIKELEENKKIAFLWGAEGAENLVTITLTETEPGTTVVKITEDGFNENDANVLYQMIDNKEGWVFMLTCLKAYLEFGVDSLRTGLVK